MTECLQGGIKAEEASFIFQELGDRYNWTVSRLRETYDRYNGILLHPLWCSLQGLQASCLKLSLLSYTEVVVSIELPFDESTTQNT